MGPTSQVFLDAHRNGEQYTQWLQYAEVVAEYVPSVVPPSDLLWDPCP